LTTNSFTFQISSSRPFQPYKNNQNRYALAEVLSL
jgi:hypothetical protein